MTAGYQGKLIEEIEVKTEPKTEKFYIFEENHAEIILMLNGYEVHSFGTLCDYYGEMACVKEAVEDAKKYATRFALTPNSEASIVVKLSTQKVKKQKTGRKMYFRPEEDEYKAVEYGCNIGEPVETIVWSSKPDNLAKEIAVKAITILKTELETTGDVKLVNHVICPGCKNPILKLTQLFDHFDCFVKMEEEQATVGKCFGCKDWKGNELSGGCVHDPREIDIKNRTCYNTGGK